MSGQNAGSNSGKGGRAGRGGPRRGSGGARTGGPGAKGGSGRRGAGYGGGRGSQGSSGGGQRRVRAGRTGGRKPAQAQNTPQTDVHDPEGVRLQKLLAAAGVGSRRACELLITQGRVEVDDQIVTELGVRIDPKAHRVRVDGEHVNLDAERAYYALNKPLGVVSSMDDDLGRPDISYMLFNRQERLFHVGRLDADTDGLLLLTNDGELANRLQHPSYEISKTYIATVRGPVAKDLGRRLREGVELEEGIVKVDSFRLIDSVPGRAVVEVVLHEGAKHVVRRLLAEAGYPVLTLTRVAVGPIKLGNQKSGRVRELNSKEIAQLHAAAGL